MAVAVVRGTAHHVPVARFTLHSHQLAKLDRFLAQARRNDPLRGAKLFAVAIEIDAVGTVRVHAAGLEPLVL